MHVSKHDCSLPPSTTRNRVHTLLRSITLSMAVTRIAVQDCHLLLWSETVLPGWRCKTLLLRNRRGTSIRKIPQSVVIPVGVLQHSAASCSIGQYATQQECKMVCVHRICKAARWRSRFTLHLDALHVTGCSQSFPPYDPPVRQQIWMPTIYR